MDSFNVERKGALLKAESFFRINPTSQTLSLYLSSRAYSFAYGGVYMRNKNKLNKLFAMVFASLLGIGLICGSTPASLKSFAEELECVDADGDGYCDICYKAMNDGRVVATGDIKCAHTHYGTPNLTAPNGCYDEPYLSYEQTGHTKIGTYTIPDGEWCDACGSNHCHGGHGIYEDHYSNVRRYRCTKTTIPCGTANMTKSGNELNIQPTLDHTVTCTINGYKWSYNSAQISTADSITMDSVGTYNCVISYTAVDKSGRSVASSTTLTYGATVDSLASNVFYIEKVPKATGYDLVLITNPDYMSYFTVKGYSWKVEKTDSTWDILPVLPQKTQNNAGTFATNTISTQNCGKFTCTVSYQGNDNKVLTKDIVCDLNDFDAEIASHIVSESVFSHKYQYFSQQNDYTQAEELCVTVKHGTNKIKDLSVRSFDETTHKVNNTLQTVLPIKTYGAKSEVAVIDATFKITNLVNGTCTKEGSSTLVGKGTLKVGIRDDITNEIYYTGQVYTLDKDCVSTIGMNILNHDCPIKSYEWKDNDNDGASDYIIIIRDCPSHGHNYVISQALDEEHDTHENENFIIKREITEHKTENACQTVKTTVKYNRFEDEWVTYKVTEERTHPFKSTLIPATCTEPAKYHYECPYCGFTYEEEAAPALGHSYIWTIVKFMTAEEDGVMTGKCSRCGHEVTKVIENPAKRKFGPRNVNADTDLPDIYIKTLVDMSRATRPGIDLSLNGINGRKNGIALSAPGMGLTSYGFTDSVGSNEAQFGIGYYEARKSLLEKIGESLKEVLKAILNGIKHIVDFFREHPVLAIIFSLVIIAIIAALVYFFGLRDRIRYKKEQKKDKSTDKK